MQKTYYISNICAASLLALAACASDDRYKQDSVWDLYDIRTPVEGVNTRAWQDPMNSSNPNYAPQSGGLPIDNDEFYIPPTGYVPR